VWNDSWAITPGCLCGGNGAALSCCPFAAALNEKCCSLPSYQATCCNHGCYGPGSEGVCCTGTIGEFACPLGQFCCDIGCCYNGGTCVPPLNCSYPTNFFPTQSPTIQPTLPPTILPAHPPPTIRPTHSPPTIRPPTILPTHPPPTIRPTHSPPTIRPPTIQPTQPPPTIRPKQPPPTIRPTIRPTQPPPTIRHSDVQNGLPVSIIITMAFIFIIPAVAILGLCAVLGRIIILVCQKRNDARRFQIHHLNEPDPSFNDIELHFIEKKQRFAANTWIPMQRLLYEI